MSVGFLPLIKSIYGSSDLPAAIADGSSKILWKNQASRDAFSLGEKFFDRLENVPCGTSLASIVSDRSLNSFNVLKFADQSIRETYYVIELIRSEKILNILNAPAIKGYLQYLCKKVRDAACVVSSSLNEIHDSVTCGEFNGKVITDNLNIIDRGLMSITKEMVDPDQFYALMDMYENEVTLIMEREINRAAKEAASVLGRKVKVCAESDRNIFFRMDRSVFEVILSGMMARTCRDVFPETLVLSAKRLKDDRAEIGIAALSSKAGKDKVLPEAGMSEEAIKNKDIFFDYICDMLCRKMNAVFTFNEITGGKQYKMEFDVIVGDKNRVSLPDMDYYSAAERFDTIPLIMSEFSQIKRYGYYDLDDDDRAREQRSMMTITVRKDNDN